MSAYEELVGRCVNAQPFLGQPGYDPADDNMRAVLAEVLRTLETVTPEMADAFMKSPIEASKSPYGSRYWLAMLRASPLTPPAGAP